MEHSRDQRPLATLSRPAWRLSLGLGGFAFLIALAIVFRLRSLFLGLDTPISISGQSLAWAARLLIVAVIVTPLLHTALHRLTAIFGRVEQRQGYSYMLLAPLILDVLAIPLLAIRPISPDATMLFAVNTALLAGDLLIYVRLRRFPAAARVVETKKQILVYER